MAYTQAQLTARAAAGKKGRLGQVYEEFPGFWNQAEINEARVEQVKKTMLRHAAQHRKRGGEGD
ncbi:MAG: hypothetical protein LIO70_03655 [Clostridiales bacterium]|nr:hypothetical protein [Clostridiales bacterium]